MVVRGFNSKHGYDSGLPPPGVGNFYSGYTPNYQFQPQPQPQFQPQWGIPSFPGYSFQPHPALGPPRDGGFPGINFRNATGGVGLPPGYDYLFPTEHCTMHVFKTKLPPWQQPPNMWDPATFVKLMVPVNTTLKELMQNLGCDNKDAGSNRLHEVQEAGNGRWVKGMFAKGDEKDKMKKSIKDMGWDASRTGKPGERPIVWLWVTKG